MQLAWLARLFTPLVWQKGRAGVSTIRKLNPHKGEDATSIMLHPPYFFVVFRLNWFITLITKDLYCSFPFLEKCVLPFHFAQSSVLAIFNSRHDNVRASSTLFIWLNENVLFVPWKVRFLAMTMYEQARHCSFGLTKTLFKLLIIVKAALHTKAQVT